MIVLSTFVTQHEIKPALAEDVTNCP